VIRFIFTKANNSFLIFCLLRSPSCPPRIHFRRGQVRRWWDVGSRQR